MFLFESTLPATTFIFIRFAVIRLVILERAKKPNKFQKHFASLCYCISFAEISPIVHIVNFVDSL